MKRATKEEDTAHNGLAKSPEIAMQEPPPMTNEMHHCLQKVSSRVDNLDQRMEALETNMDKIEWDMKSTITCRCLTQHTTTCRKMGLAWALALLMRMHVESIYC